LKDSLRQYDTVIKTCKEVFIKKTRDYGTAWRILRLPSLTDQIFIKASRIRSIEEKSIQKVEDSVEAEYIGIINYCLISMMQEAMADSDEMELPLDMAEGMYDGFVAKTRMLFEAKNHDYDEIWREMRISSYTDLILMKILRIKQIEDNLGRTLISEGVSANYMDIMNYAVFALIKLSENKAP
jgi:hypothetical protein